MTNSFKRYFNAICFLVSGGIIMFITLETLKFLEGITLLFLIGAIATIPSRYIDKLERIKSEDDK